MTFMASWPGGASAWPTEDEAQRAADRIVRGGYAPHVVVWELDDEGPESHRNGTLAPEQGVAGVVGHSTGREGGAERGEER